MRSSVPTPPTRTTTNDPFRTQAESIDVELESERVPEPRRDAPRFDPRASVPSPRASLASANEHLAHAAAPNPAEMTWASIVLPNDPVLRKKREPQIAARRERLTRIVKVTLGACLGICVLAIGASALASDPSALPSAAAHAGGKRTPSTGVVSLETFDGAKHAKVVRRAAPAVTSVANLVRPKRR